MISYNGRSRASWSAWTAALVIAAMFQVGCATANTAYRPTRGAPGELSLKYDNGFQLINGDKVVSRSPRYEGLPEFVACVPDAYRHATAARAEGSKGTTLQWLSIGFAVAGLGGLSGLAFQSQDPNLALGLLVGGVVTEVLAIAMGGASAVAKNQSLGHMTDSVNFYNDAVGFQGKRCLSTEPSSPSMTAPDLGSP